MSLVRAWRNKIKLSGKIQNLYSASQLSYGHLWGMFQAAMDRHALMQPLLSNSQRRAVPNTGRPNPVL
jgi:hypothetical protein